MRRPDSRKHISVKSAAGRTACLMLCCALAASGLPGSVTVRAAEVSQDTGAEKAAEAESEAVTEAAEVISESITETSAGGEGSGKESVDNAVQTSAAEKKDDFRISSEKDWEEFVRASHSADWSVGRTVRLEKDIELYGREAERVVYFAGIFEGAGHVINGVTIRAAASDVGIFEILEKGAEIRNLRVVGAILPDGSRENAGGIVGVNRGTIENCAFQGSVDVHTSAGGIAGRNTESGLIRACRVGGIVAGDSSIGGIAGYNEGRIEGCTNDAQVNTVYTDVPFSTDELTVTLDDILQNGRITTVQNYDQKVDMGGIAGFNNGEISRCTNTGNIGYEHVGYNVGGIAGRSNGLIRNCVNDGDILGRRDVGGIVGQQQPDLMISFSESTMGEIKTSLDELHITIDSALSDTEGYTNDASAKLTEIAKLVGNAKNNVQTITGDAADRADQAAQKLTTATSALQLSLKDLSTAGQRLYEYAVKVRDAALVFDKESRKLLDDVRMSDADKKKLNTALDDFEYGLQEISDSCEALRELMESIDAGAPDESASMNKLKSALSGVTDAYTKMGRAAADIISITSKYQESKDVTESDFYKDVTGLNTEITNGKDAIGRVTEKSAEALKTLQGKTEEAAAEAGNAAAEAEAAAENASPEVDEAKLNSLYGEIVTAADDLKKAQENVSRYTGGEEGQSKLEKDFESARQGLKDAGATDEELAKIQQDIETLKTQSSRAEQDITTIENSLGNGIESSEFFRVLNDEVRPAIADLADSVEMVADASADIVSVLSKYRKQLAGVDTGAFDSSYTALRDSLAALPDINTLVPGAVDRLTGLDLSISGVSPSARAASGDLYATIDQMIRSSDALNESLRGATSGTVGNLKDINSQMDHLGDLIEQAVGEQLNRSTDINDYKEDVSAKKYDEAVSGRTTGSTNNASVSADSDAGGIAGFMGVDLEINPERDIAVITDRTGETLMLEKDIVDNCVNTGKVYCRNNYAGGIAGRMLLGLAADCRSLGDVCAGNNYAGGIAGYSGGVIMNNLVKTEVKALSYAGGIVGKGTTLAGNRSLAVLADSGSPVGAVAAAVEDISAEKVSGNIYYGGEIHGIGDVDYDEMAERGNYEDVAEGNERFFGQLRLVFEAEGEVIDVVTVAYGDDVPEARIPAVPEREGFFGKWSRSDFSHITVEEKVIAEYTRVVTLIRGNLKRNDGKPVFFAEGAFDTDDALEDHELPIQDGADSYREDGPREKYSISIPDDGTDHHTIRFLPSEDADSVMLVKVSDDGERTELKTGTMGAYMTFEAEGTELVLEVYHDESLLKMFGLPAAIAGGVIIIGAAVITAVRKKKKKKESADEEPEQEDDDADKEDEGKEAEE